MDSESLSPWCDISNVTGVMCSPGCPCASTREPVKSSDNYWSCVGGCHLCSTSTWRDTGRPCAVTPVLHQGRGCLQGHLEYKGCRRGRLRVNEPGSQRCTVAIKQCVEIRTATEFREGLTAAIAYEGVCFSLSPSRRFRPRSKRRWLLAFSFMKYGECLA